MKGVLTILAAAALLQNQAPVFRTNTSGVLVDVVVTDNRGSVPNLTADDFEVLDNGVRQNVTDVAYGRLPIDLRMVFDISSSLADSQLQMYVHAMTQVGATLNAGDRSEVWAFGRWSLDLSPLTETPVAPALTRVGNDGTSFFDAVAMAMITAPRPGRRQLTIVLSDGHDTSSFFDEPALIRAAQRTDAVVYTMAPPPAPDTARSSTTIIVGGTTVSTMVRQLAQPPPAEVLETLATTTGGRLLTLDRSGDVAASFLKAVDEFRQSYVLYFTPQGAARAGWHALRVSVKGKSYTVRARQGYEGTR